MAYYGYMHMSTIYVKKGDVLNGKAKVGYISDNGIYATGKHLHVQKMASNDKGNWSDTFVSDSDSLDPTSDFKKYGEPSPNDITVPYHSTPYPYNSSGMHQGVDYSGVIDKPYEEPYAYSLEKAKMKVIDVIYNDKYFGNFVVLQIIGNKEEDTLNATNITTNNGNQVKIKILTSREHLKLWFVGNKEYSTSGSNLISREYSKGYLTITYAFGDNIDLGTYVVKYENENGSRQDLIYDTNQEFYVFEKSDYIDVAVLNKRIKITKLK